MVRTVDFQSTNEGSNPSSPNIYKIKNLNIIFKLINKKKKKIEKKIKYSIGFSSLVSPFVFNNLYFNQFNKNNTLTKKKILIKQSYILLTWFFYISFICLKKNKKNKIKIFVAPLKKKIFTCTKAPIAHKKNSKEQYKFLFYNYTISFNARIDKNITNLDNSSIYSTIIFFFLTKKNFFNFETNLLFLKNFKTFLTFKDSNYFNFYKLI